jgi:hypothetical protein
MHLQVGNRLADETGEWQVIGRPYTTSAGKDAHVRVKKVSQPEVTEIRTWVAYERVVTVSADLQAFIHNSPSVHPQPPSARPPNRRPDRARLERLPADRGVPVRRVFGRWVTPEEADADLLRLAELRHRTHHPTDDASACLHFRSCSRSRITASAIRWALKGLARFASAKV